MSEDFLAQNEDRTATIIHGPNGPTLVRQVTLTSGVTANGVRVGETLQHAHRTLDGRICANPAELYQCMRCKRGPWSTAAITMCPCGKVVCREKCTRTIDENHYCPRCNWKIRVWKVLRWLVTI